MKSSIVGLGVLTDSFIQKPRSTAGRLPGQQKNWLGHWAGGGNICGGGVQTPGQAETEGDRKNG